MGNTEILWQKCERADQERQVAVIHVIDDKKVVWMVAVEVKKKVSEVYWKGLDLLLVSIYFLKN